MSNSADLVYTLRNKGMTFREAMKFFNTDPEKLHDYISIINSSKDHPLRAFNINSVLAWESDYKDVSKDITDPILKATLAGKEFIIRRNKSSENGNWVLQVPDCDDVGCCYFNNPKIVDELVSELLSRWKMGRDQKITELEDKINECKKVIFHIDEERDYMDNCEECIEMLRSYKE